MDLLQTIGAILAVILSVFKARDSYRARQEKDNAYVSCSLNIQRQDGHTFAEVAVENQFTTRRSINWAFLVISPCGRSFLAPLALGNDMLSKNGGRTNDLIHLKTNDVIQRQDRNLGSVAVLVL